MPLRYRGYVYDTETQLYYLQSRYYNPKVGRFVNADGLISTGQGMLGNNMFAYCLNNPTVYTDGTGTAARNCLSSDGQISDKPWRHTGLGGGYRQGHHKLSVEDLVLQSSDITEGTVIIDGVTYTTFFVAVHVNCFLGENTKYDTVADIVLAYTEYLYQEIESRKNQVSIILRCPKNIYIAR